MRTGGSGRVSPTEDPELFWAVRGGGGDFGIITALELRLMPGFQLFGGRLLWPVEQMPEGCERSAPSPPRRRRS